MHDSDKIEIDKQSLPGNPAGFLFWGIKGHRIKYLRVTSMFADS
jgi:hypothetical protein